MSLTREEREQRAEVETRPDDDMVLVSGKTWKTDCYHEIDDEGNCACRCSFEKEPIEMTRGEARDKGKVPCGYWGCRESLDNSLPGVGIVSPGY